MFQKISILPPWRGFWFWKFQVRLILSFKHFGLENPIPLGIPNDPLWWEYGYFQESHNGKKKNFR